MDDLITTAEAAGRLGINPDSVRDAIHRGQLAAKRLGRDWLVSAADVERYASEQRGKPGRKGVTK